MSKAIKKKKISVGVKGATYGWLITESARQDLSLTQYLEKIIIRELANPSNVKKLADDRNFCQVTVLLTLEDREKLQKISSDAGISMSKYVRRLIKQEMAR